MEEATVSSIKFLKESYERLKTEIRKVIVGQEEVVEQLLIAMFSRGHCLIVGVPGLAKTLLVSTVARALSLKFSRIQFTPDLMPADITGTEVIQEDRASGSRSFRFLPGPIFANVILADEINRTPPKTQSALLQAMQEKQVTVGGTTYNLEEPFFVLATQNPIEQEGTYPLPEAQLDRFMFEVRIDYPSEEEELDVLRLTTAPFTADVNPVLTAQDILRLQLCVREVPAPEHTLRYAERIVRLSRPALKDAPEFIRRWVSWGAGPRAGQCLVLGAKARASLYGRLYATIEDIKAVAHPVLRHRIITNFSAEAEGKRTDDIVDMLLEEVEPFESELEKDERTAKILRPENTGEASGT